MRGCITKPRFGPTISQRFSQGLNFQGFACCDPIASPTQGRVQYPLPTYGRDRTYAGEVRPETRQGPNPTSMTSTFKIIVTIEGIEPAIRVAARQGRRVEMADEGCNFDRPSVGDAAPVAVGRTRRDPLRSMSREATITWLEPNVSSPMRGSAVRRLTANVVPSLATARRELPGQQASCRQGRADHGRGQRHRAQGGDRLCARGRGHRDL